MFLAAGAEDLVALAEQLVHGVFVPDDVDGKRLQGEQGENSELSPAHPQRPPAKETPQKAQVVLWKTEKLAGNADSCLFSSSKPNLSLSKTRNQALKIRDDPHPRSSLEEKLHHPFVSECYPTK